MTYETWTPRFTSVYRGHSFRKAFFHVVYGPLTVTLCILLGSGILYTFVISRDSGHPASVAGKTSLLASLDASKDALKGTTSSLAASDASPGPYGMLFDPSFTANLELVPLAENPSLGPRFASVSPSPIEELTDTGNVEAAQPVTPDTPKIVQSVPLPTPRPQDLTASNDVQFRPLPPTRQVTQAKTIAAPAPADSRSLFEKLFGLSGNSSGPALAYAAPEDGPDRNSKMVPLRQPLPYDHWTAVYDITARTVYLPDGTKLEAHSGLGDRLDDPRYVSERMHGATPPHVYDLKLREQLFHGVQALRLTPVGEGDVYGRTGLLAHRYMLGPNGDSNGCVSIKDYDAFLQAYRNGQIKRLAVVARLN